MPRRSDSKKTSAKKPDAKQSGGKQSGVKRLVGGKPSAGKKSAETQPPVEVVDPSLRAGPPPRKQAAGKPSGAGSASAGPQRLQRVLAAAGFGSRRQCEELITEQRVEVDGKIVDQLGAQVDPSTAKIFVDGSPVKRQRHVYFLLNKPPGVVTTNRDPQGRTRVIDLIQERERVFPVGRLDRSSEGLILLTNDGDFAQQLTHPKYGVRKIYRVTVAGKVDSAKLAEMRKGIYIAEGRVAVDGAKVLKHRGKATEMEILLREGKNREIRRILARLGHKVLTLQRVAMGPLRLGELPRGAYRAVTATELRRLREEVFHQSRRAADGFESDDEGAKAGRDAKVAGPRKPPRSKSPQGKPAGKPDALAEDDGEEFEVRGTEDKSSAAKGAAAKGSETRGQRAGRELYEPGLVDPMLASDSKVRGTIIGDDSPAADEPAARRSSGRSAGRSAGRKATGGDRGAGRKSAGRKSAGGKSTGGKGSAPTGKRGAGGKFPGGGNRGPKRGGK
ncbi:pseudouridine synthase [Planctomycetaceae bacterium SH139]